MNLEKLAEKLEDDFYDIEIIKENSFLFHSTFLENGRNIIEKGFKGTNKNYHRSSYGDLKRNPGSVTFATEDPQNEYGDTIIEIEVTQYIKAKNFFTDDEECLIQLRDIINVSEYCD